MLCYVMLCYVMLCYVMLHIFTHLCLFFLNLPSVDISVDQSPFSRLDSNDRKNQIINLFFHNELLDILYKVFPDNTLNGNFLEIKFGQITINWCCKE